ncbi:MAG: sulfite exporter TauE/SafE family protein [Planctomycetota bacterium]|nr:MAG: sulfite exporter TauE/SafE family protein [Planctomycetota bacterium]
MNGEAKQYTTLNRSPYYKSRRIRIWSAAIVAIVAVLCVQSVLPELKLLPAFASGTGAAIVLAIFLTALLCEYIDSSMGMGYGTTLTPLLLLVGYDPLQIVPAVLISEFVTGIAASFMHHCDGNMNLLNNRRERGTAILLSSLSILGAVTAVIIALHIPQWWLGAIIGVIILSVGVVILATFKKRFRYRRSHIIALGTIAAFNKGLSGGGYGPLVTAGQVVSGISPKQAVGITSLAEGVTCFVGLTAYILMYGQLDWALTIPLTLGALFSVPIATLTVRHMPEYIMRAGIGVCTCSLGMLSLIKLVW